MNLRYSDYYTTYNPITKILSKTLMTSKDPIKLDQGMTVTAIDETNAQAACYASKLTIVSTKCLDVWREQAIKYATYSILTKWEAINNLIYRVDVGLFDSYWAKKKETQIEEQTNL